MSEDLIAQLTASLGPTAILTEPADMAPFLAEERGLYHGRARCVARPSTTAEVAAVVSVCAAAGVGIVPQGGNTGLCGGAAPDDSGDQVILSLSRMNRVRAIDATNYTISVEAGVVLQTIQQTAEDAGCLFPISLAAEGSCQIGGNISTNAGGTAVLRYGNTRDTVLGLEVVLPDGRVWDGMRILRKDNTGYDLKQLFIGGEGTLGIVTAAVLKLYPKPAEIQTALCALNDLDSALALLSRARATSGDQVSTFELVPRLGLDLVMRHQDGVSDPFVTAYPWYALIELTSSRPDSGLAESLETVLESAIEDGLVADAVVAGSIDQRRALWRIRESIPEAQKREGASIKHDVSVPTASVPAFIRRATEAVEAASPGVRVVPFGHLGDGNIHFNLTQPVGAARQRFLDDWERMNRIVHDIVADMRGSFSAEHGIGKLKRDELAHYKTPLELELMRRVKAAFDPHGIMNPGKVI